MALNRVSLGFPVAVSAATTSTVYTNPSSTKSFVRCIIVHNASIDTTTTTDMQMQIYVVAAAGGSVGTAAAADRIARVNLAANDTFFFEPQYPITLTSANDSIQVYNEGTNNSGASSNNINVMVLGDTIST